MVSTFPRPPYRVGTIWKVCTMRNIAHMWDEEHNMHEAGIGVRRMRATTPRQRKMSERSNARKARTGK